MSFATLLCAGSLCQLTSAPGAEDSHDSETTVEKDHGIGDECPHLGHAPLHMLETRRRVGWCKLTDNSEYTT